MLPDEKKLRTPITYESADGLLTEGFDHINHKSHMYVLFASFGDGDWWTEFLHDAISGWMLTEDFDTMSRSERLRRSDAIKFLAAYLRKVSGGANKKGQRPSEASRMRVITTVMGEPLMQLLATKQS